MLFSWMSKLPEQPNQRGLVIGRICFLAMRRWQRRLRDGRVVIAFLTAQDLVNRLETAQPAGGAQVRGPHFEVVLLAARRFAKGALFS
jgi:hypothetical protein